MKKILFIILLFSSFIYFQKFNFLNNTYKEITVLDFRTFKSKDTLFVAESFLETGKSIIKPL